MTITTNPIDQPFNVFDALTQTGTSRLFITVHNVRLIDVQPTEDGYELLTIEHAGVRCELIGGGRWNQEYSRRDIGRFGYVVPAHPHVHVGALGACYFYSYIDQSLRRVPEFDGNHCGALGDGIGWRCNAQPHGFRAPIGIIPGEAGRFVPDETVAVTLRVPPEFVRKCQQVQMMPEELLRSFVGDLADIENILGCPRADHYNSGGSDERDYAQAWFDRAHGMRVIDLEALEAVAEERQTQREDFFALLDDYEYHGGKADDLFAAIQTLVDKQSAA